MTPTEIEAALKTILNTTATGPLAGAKARTFKEGRSRTTQRGLFVRLPDGTRFELAITMENEE
jgi:hypothetical protein